jgi:hypothetical protein
LLRGIGSELDHEPSAAFGEHRQAFGVDAFAAGVAGENVVEALEADGFELHHFWNSDRRTQRCRDMRRLTARAAEGFRLIGKWLRAL